MNTESTAVELTADEAIERLIVWQETYDPCEGGHVEHTSDDHLGRSLVHSRSPKGFGADWDEEAVRLFIKKAIRIVDLGRRDHPIAVFSDDGDGPRWMKFDARPKA